VEIRSETQLNPVADEVAAITAVVRPILYGILFALKDEAVRDAGGRENLLLRQLPRVRRQGDGDCGICFEYAVHDALNRNEPAVMERVSDALTLCRIGVNSDVSSILFGVEKSGSQDLIDTAASRLTDGSSLMYGTRGRPVRLKSHLTGIATAFRKPSARANLPQSISGVWKADLFIGGSNADKWVGTTVKINPSHLESARGLRVGIVPTREGTSDAVRVDEKRNLVICPVPYDASFMETFYLAWETVQQFLFADAELPKEVSLPRPAQRAVARYLADRRAFKVLDVIEALAPLSQPELLKTEEDQATVVSLKTPDDERAVNSVLAPEPRQV
jgi:hypothetical protein